VTLKRGEIVYRADEDIDAVYFPEEAVVAMVDTTEDRRTIEVGIIGREGFVGINIFLRGVVTPDRAIVQLPGRMNVVNKPGLKERSCECYGFIRRQYKSLQAEMRRLLSQRQQRQAQATGRLLR
jgi:hypothetical protein